MDPTTSIKVTQGGMVNGPAAGTTIAIGDNEHEYGSAWKRALMEFAGIAAVAAFSLARWLIAGSESVSSVSTGFTVLVLIISVPGLIKNFKILTDESWPSTRKDLLNRWTLTALMSILAGASFGWLLASVLYGDLDQQSISLVIAATASISTLVQIRPRTAAV